MPEVDKINELMESDSRIADARKNSALRLDRVKTSPLEAQIAFLKELVKSPEVAAEFQKDPKRYAVDHGVLLDPAVVKAVTNAVVYDAALDPDFKNQLGPHALKDIVDMRAGGRLKPGTQANAAAIAAGAAVVMAVVAVVTMVVTLVRAKKPEDLLVLQGLGERGIILPGNRAFQARDLIKGVNRF